MDAWNAHKRHGPRLIHCRISTSIERSTHPPFAERAPSLDVLITSVSWRTHTLCADSIGPVRHLTKITCNIFHILINRPEMDSYGTSPGPRSTSSTGSPLDSQVGESGPGNIYSPGITNSRPPPDQPSQSSSTAANNPPSIPAACLACVSTYTCSLPCPGSPHVSDPRAFISIGLTLSAPVPPKMRSAASI